MAQWKHLLLIGVVLLAGAVARGQSLEEVRKDFEAGEYRACLSKASKALSLLGVNASKEEVFELQMLRGEALLRLRERKYAMDAFNSAVKSGPDFAKAAQAKAYAVIIARSEGGLYKPAGGGEAISIVDPAARKRAMSAALADGLKKETPRITAALEGKQLPPMLELIPVLGDLYVLEYASTGEPKKVGEILKGFGEHARTLMKSELARVSKRVGQLNDLSNSMVVTNNVLGDNIDRRGLWTPERNELSDLMTYVEQIRQAALKGRQIAKSFGASGENWDGLIAEAGEVAGDAQEVWEHRY